MEKRLIKKIQAGKKDFFVEIYDLYFEKIYKFVYFKTFHTETSEDITSQVFLQAFEKIDSFDNSRIFSAWIFTIARNLVTDHFRTNKNHLDIEDFWDISSQEDVEIDVSNKVLVDEIKKDFSILSSLQREIIILRFWKDLPFKEIASILWKTQASVKMDFKRWIGKLKKKQILLLLFLLLKI